MLVGIIVGFANERPPSDQDFAYCVIEAESEVIASQIAAQMAACHSEMPTSTTIHTVYEI